MANFKVERYIDAFHKVSEELAYDVKVDGIKVEVLKDIFKPNEEDREMYLVYDIGSEEAIALKNYIDIEFDFSEYTYQLSCYSA